jgi:hypothetical protein
MLTFRNEKLDDPENFIEGMQGVVSINEFSEAKAVFVFRMSLREEAKDWVSSLPVNICFNMLIEKFRSRFVGRTTCLTYIKKMAKEVYTEGSVLNYFDMMKGWARRTCLPDEVLVALVLNGLPEWLGNSLLLNARTNLTWEFVYSSCEGIELRGSNRLGMNENINAAISYNEKKLKNKNIKCFECGKLGHVAKKCWSKLKRLGRRNEEKLKVCEEI